VEIRVLKYFLAVAEDGNITTAARKLHMTQPALSRQMMELEKELGKRLFVRTNKRTFLTEDGLYLKQRAQEIVSLAERTVSEMQTAPEDICGQVRFGAVETDAMRVFARAIGRIREKYAHVRFDLFSGNTDDILEKLEDGILDFGLVFGEAISGKYERLAVPCANARGILMRRDSPWAGCERITPEILRDMPLITPSRALYNETFLSQWCRNDIGSLHIVATYNLIYNAVFMVEAGVGNALCLANLVNLTENSELCFCPLDPPSYETPTLVWKRGKTLSRAAEVFLEEVRGQLTV